MNDIRKRKKVFQKLIKACHEQDAYSVPIMCAKAKISYVQIQAWAQEDKIWADILKTCKNLCEDNAERAVLLNKMPLEEMMPFMSEYK